MCSLIHCLLPSAAICMYITYNYIHVRNIIISFSKCTAHYPLCVFYTWHISFYWLYLIDVEHWWFWGLLNALWLFQKSGFCPRDFFRGALQLLLTLWKPKWLGAKGTKSNKHWKDCVAVKRVRLGMNCLTSVFARRSSSAFLSDSARPSLEPDWLTRCCPETSCVAITCVSWLSRVLCTLRCGVICCLLDVHLSCGPVKIAPTFLGGAETEGCLKPPPRLHCLNFNSTVAQIVLAILQWLSPSASAAQRAPMSALQVKCSPILTCSSHLYEVSHCICPIQRFYCQTKQQEQIATCKNEVSITSFPSQRSFALLVSLGKLGGTRRTQSVQPSHDGMVPCLARGLSDTLPGHSAWRESASALGQVLK